MIRRNIFRSGAFAALLAIALQAFWPLLAQARPGDRTLQVSLCSVDGATHGLEIKVGKTTPLDERAASHGDHCKLCTLGDGKTVLHAVVVQVFALGFSSNKVENLQSSFRDEFELLAAQPRAPPAVS